MSPVNLDATPVLFLIAVTQSLGLTSTWLARMSEGTRGQFPCQMLFFATFVLMSLATAAATQISAGWFIGTGTVLTLMTIGATLDFQIGRAPAAPAADE